MALHILEGPHQPLDRQHLHQQGLLEMEDAQSKEPHTWGSPSSFVQLVVSHAYSDGYTGLPLILDFSALYSQAVAEAAAETQGQQLAVCQTVPLPYGASLDDLQDRFFSTLDCRPQWSHPDQASLRASCFDGNWAPRWPPWVYNHEVLLESGAVASLRASAKRYGLPFDVVLLSLVLAATFRSLHELASRARSNRARTAENGTSSTANDNVEHSDELEEVLKTVSSSMALPLTLYAPMRDGHLNEAMAGLFSDWRDMVVPCSSSSTILGTCMEVADTIRNRRWSVYDPFQNTEQILVNILALDEQSRGARSFQQTRAHEYGGRRTALPRARRAWKQAHRPMRITLEQEAYDAWWISLDINAERYPTAWCRGFVRSLQGCMDELAHRPLAPVLMAARAGQHQSGVGGTDGSHGQDHEASPKAEQPQHSRGKSSYIV